MDDEQIGPDSATDSPISSSRMPAAGQTVSHYRVLGRVGAGGMGVVYRAEDLKLGRQVALKFLHEGADSDRDARARFRREARTASLLSHPNICTIFEIDEVDGKTFIAFELLDGETLDQRIAAGPFSLRDVLDIGSQTADAIGAAHAEGILHRDIKPANIYITRRGQVKVLDFGLAKPVSQGRASGLLDATDLTRLDDIVTTTTGIAVGTIAYMSPEQARGESLDPRSDLFSFGVVLYEMATGHRTFKGSTSAVIFDAILNRDPVPPRQLNPELPEELERIVFKALEKDRELRYQTAADLRADLQRLRRTEESGRFATLSGSGRSAFLTQSGSSSGVASGSRPAADSVAGPTDPTVLTPAIGSRAHSVADQSANPSAMRSEAFNRPSGVSPIPEGYSPGAPTVERPAGTSSSTGLLLSIAAVVTLAVAGAFYLSRDSGPTVATPLELEASQPEIGSPSASAPSPDSPALPGGATSPALSSGSSSASAGGAAGVPVAPPATASAATASPSAAGRARAGGPGAPAVSGTAAGSSAAGARAAIGAPPASASGAATSPSAPDVASARTAVTDMATELRVIADKIDARLYDQAAGDLRALVARTPNDATMLPAYFQLADVLEKQGKRDDAMSTYSDVASRFPGHPRSIEARVRLARSIIGTNRRTRDQDARQVLAGISSELSGPALAEGLELKATIEQRLRVREMDPVLQTSAPAAVITLRSLVERVPDAPQVEGALLTLARSYEELRRFEHAASAMAQLAAKFPAKHANEMWFQAAEMYERRTTQLKFARDAYASVPRESRRFEEAQRRIERLDQQLAR